MVNLCWRFWYICVPWDLIVIHLYWYLPPAPEQNCHSQKNKQCTTHSTNNTTQIETFTIRNKGQLKQPWKECKTALICRDLSPWKYNAVHVSYTLSMVLHEDFYATTPVFVICKIERHTLIFHHTRWNWLVKLTINTLDSGVTIHLISSVTSDHYFITILIWTWSWRLVSILNHPNIRTITCQAITLFLTFTFQI